MGAIEQATCASEGALARDQDKLALVRDLRVLPVDVIQALQDDPAPPSAVAVPAPSIQASSGLHAEQFRWESRC